MQDFSDFHDAVREFMDEFGSYATYVAQLDVGEYDPATGTNSTNVSEFQVRAIMTDMSLRSNGLASKLNTLIQEGDKVLYVQPTDSLLPILYPYGILVVDPTDDKIIIAGVTYKVVTAKTVDPTGSVNKPILYELYVRR